MDTDLVRLAQNGDREAFTSLAAAVAARFLAGSRRTWRDYDLAEDATQQALLKIWRDLPMLRDPETLRCLVLPHPRERLLRGGQPDPALDAEHPTPAGRRTVGVGWPQLGRRSGPAGAEASATSRSTIGRLLPWVTISTCPSTSLPPRTSASRPGRSPLDCITRCGACARHSMPTRGRRRRRSPDERRRVVTRIVRSWLKEDAHQDAERLLDGLRHQLDTAPQRRPRPAGAEVS